MSADESSWWARGAMCGVGQSAPGGGPLIGVERRRFPPRQGTSWRGEPRRLDRQLALGHWTRSTTQNYKSDTLTYRTCTFRIEERTCGYIMWCQPNGHDTVWLITRTLMLRLMGCRPERGEFVYVRLFKLYIICTSTTWLKCALWGTIPSYALWSCGRGGASII